MWHERKHPEGPAMQLWPATIASPLHEAYAHGVSNYSVSPQGKATSVESGRRTQTRLLASVRVAFAFFLWRWLVCARVLQAQETQRHRPIETTRTSWSGYVPYTAARPLILRRSFSP